MNDQDILKAKNIIEELFYDEHSITQWQYEILETVVMNIPAASSGVSATYAG